MIYHYTVIEDQSIFITDLRNRLGTADEFIFRFVDFNTTAERDIDTYVRAFAESKHLPDIIFVDHDLDWNDGCKYNGKQVIQRIIELYPEKRKPYLIFISGPFVDQINKDSNNMRFTHGDMAIALDKSEYDEVPEGATNTKLEIALQKATESLDLQEKNHGKIVLEVYPYPDLKVTSLMKSAGTFTGMRRNPASMIEIDNATFGAIIFHTAYNIDLALLVLIKDNKPENYLIPLDRLSRARWVDKFFKEGLSFEPQGKSIIYNSAYFYVNQDKKIDTKNLELKKKLFTKLLYEVALPDANPNNHPFLFALHGFA